MIRNMNLHWRISANGAMLTLIEKGMTHEQAYDLCSTEDCQSWDNQVDSF